MRRLLLQRCLKFSVIKYDNSIKAHKRPNQPTKNNNNKGGVTKDPEITKTTTTESSAICRGCKDDQNLRSFCFQNQFRKEARQRSGPDPGPGPNLERDGSYGSRKRQSTQ